MGLEPWGAFLCFGPYKFCWTDGSREEGEACHRLGKFEEIEGKKLF